MMDMREIFSLVGTILLVLAFTKCNSQAGLNYSNYGEINIGGLFPLHFYDEPERKCGELREIGSLRRLEAMVYAIEKINQNSSILNNITLGYEIYDTCSYLAESLKQSLNFIPPYRKSLACNCNDSETDRDGLPRILGVVGPQRSSSSVQSTILLGLYDIPQVSYLSTSDELSNDERYPYFLRTVPPDSFQVKAMIDILKMYNWRYVAFINSDDTYGKSAQQEFRIAASKEDICLAFTRTISESAETSRYQDIVAELIQAQRESHVTAVILFMQVEMARRIFETVAEEGVERHFIWIGSDGWGNYDLQPVEDYEEAALGCFTVLPLSGNLPEYDEHFRSIRRSDRNNPWLEDFIDTYGSCDSQTDNPETGNECRPFDNMDASDSPTHETLVIDSVNALAFALDNLHKDVCPDTPTMVCDEMVNVKGETVKEYILKVEVNSIANGKVMFLQNGDSQGKYSVRNLQLVNGSYQFVDVGKWIYDEGGMGLTIEADIPWYVKPFRKRDPETEVPISVCSEPCGVGERQNTVPENACCWTCTKCDVDEIVTDNGTRCTSCVNTTAHIFGWPEEGSNFTTCVPIDPKDSLTENILGVVVVVFSAAGLVLTNIILFVYIKNREEPLIKASSRELCYVIFTGIYLAYIVALANGLPPRSITCVLRRIGPVLATSLIYIPLCTKTIRLYRIFHAGRKSARRPKFISPSFQMVLTFSITAIPLTWSLIWTIITPPEVEVLMPFDDRPLVELSCTDSIISSVGITLWDVTVVFVCCVYAFMTRKLPDNYNETRFITFCVFSTLVVYATFSPAYYTAAEARYKASYTALGLIIQSTVALICLFAVKIYALYFVDDEEMHIFTQTRIRANTRNSVNRTTNASGDSPSHVPAPPASFRVAPAANPSYVADDSRPLRVTTISGNNIVNNSKNQNNNASQRHNSTSLLSNSNQQPRQLMQADNVQKNGKIRNSKHIKNRVGFLNTQEETTGRQTLEVADPAKMKGNTHVTFDYPIGTNTDFKSQDGKIIFSDSMKDGCIYRTEREENC